jgi:myo-inositol-1(or 4)-monophosphatase
VTEAGTAASANAFPALGDTYVAGPDGARRNGERVAVSDVSEPERALVAPLMLWTRERRDEFAAATRAVVTRFDDLRRVGSAQLTLSMIAAGELDGTITNLSPPPWDTVAGVHLIREAGGEVTNLAGDRWSPGDEGLVASNGQLHAEFLSAARTLPGGE